MLQVVWAHVHGLLEAGLKPQDIGIITPYNAQVCQLRGLRPASLAALEVSTVDGFQGGHSTSAVTMKNGLAVCLAWYICRHGALLP